MNNPDEPLIDNNDMSESPLSKADPAVRERIQNLVDKQPYAVLCVQGNNQPYGALVAFAFSDDLRHAVFVTPVATRKGRLPVRLQSRLQSRKMRQWPNGLRCCKGKNFSRLPLYLCLSLAIGTSHEDYYPRTLWLQSRLVGTVLASVMSHLSQKTLDYTLIIEFGLNERNLPCLSSAGSLALCSSGVLSGPGMVFSRRSSASFAIGDAG